MPISTDIKLFNERIRGNELGTSKTLSLPDDRGFTFFSDGDTREWKAMNSSEKKLHCRVKKLGSRNWESTRTIPPHSTVSFGLPSKKTILVQYSHHPFPHNKPDSLAKLSNTSKEELHARRHLSLKKPREQELSNYISRTIGSLASSSCTAVVPRALR
ncbi:hypothetical protein PCANC_09413 [Puccinia coronata f. sp. avenae]|uniref:Uncharacterized protein n=1 Tax=Puccinia coronata f. sp. avenae TaxID=200324 RepID=A0A2N5TXB0_9BASI|nr:hypothetical protein PCANC_23928 [Puccinia coronata f. sp. avenae]PLW47968.1 hypothetical protein PCANC_09413 [Puccinia coronata f. sp. avenae]